MSWRQSRKGAEGGEDRQQHAGDVVGGDRPDEQGQRREEQREPGDGGRPEQVDAVGGPDRPRDERVLGVQNRVGPPAEAPDERLGVGAEADVVAPRLDQEPQTEIEEGEDRVGAENRDVRGAAAREVEPPAGNAHSPGSYPGARTPPPHPGAGPSSSAHAAHGSEPRCLRLARGTPGLAYWPTDLLACWPTGRRIPWERSARSRR